MTKSANKAAQADRLPYPALQVVRLLLDSLGTWEGVLVLDDTGKRREMAKSSALVNMVHWCYHAHGLFSHRRTLIMSRLTITLDDNLHRALKETAARQGRSIASIIEESLRLRGIRDQASARKLVEMAQERAGLDAEQALQLAIDETRAARGQ